MRRISKYLFLSILIMSLCLSCRFWASFKDEGQNNISSVTFDRNKLELSVGTMEIINVTVISDKGTNRETVSWSYDKKQISAVTDDYSIIITGTAPGTSVIKATCGNRTASCAITVQEAAGNTKVENPYVYVSSDYVSLSPGSTDKVFGSVFGLSQADKNGYTFTSDKPSVASVYTEGNYCWITGKSEGVAKITCRHSNCSFPYSFLVGVYASDSKIPYITSSSNIVTLNKTGGDTASVTVDLQNPTYTTYADDFTFSVTDSGGNAMAEPPVSLETRGNRITITPVTGGNCYIKVEHPLAAYAFNILVRVVENIDAAYIEPSGTDIMVDGISSETLSFTIKGLPEGTAVDPDKYEWVFSDYAGNYLDYNIFNGTEPGKGDSVWLTGKKNGTVKITVSHPLCPVSRSVIVMVRNIPEEAGSSKIYITTSQNFVETKVGNGESIINITVNNLTPGEESNLNWAIENNAADGSADPVIQYSGGTGTSTSVNSRSVFQMAKGKAYITPLKEGMATITITHPKAAYPAKILVNVLPEGIFTSYPVVLSTETPYLLIKNGETGNIKVSLSGSSNPELDATDLNWTCSAPDKFTVNSSGLEANITAKGTGTNKGILTVTHPKSEYPLSIVLVSYDNHEELAGIKTIYTGQNAFTMYPGENQTLSVETVDYTVSENDDGTGTDCVVWTVTKGYETVAGISENGTLALVTAVSPGVAEITCSLADYPDEKVVFYINVKQPGVIEPDKPCYLTTGYNVITTNTGKTADISVEPVNIQMSEYNKITWENNNPDIFSLSYNGNTASVMPLAEGNGTITVSHPLSNNTLEITVHIGSEYVYNNTDIGYISCNDTLGLKTDSGETMFSAVVAFTESSRTENSGFVFSSSDTSVFTVSYSSENNYCYVTPVKAGQAVLKIHHDKAEFDKEVIVIIQKTAQELSDIPYISTGQNVVTVIQGEYTSISATLENAESYEPADWTWTSLDGNISDVALNSGTTAMISGVKPGTTKIRVSHTDCIYPLDIIVICLDKDSVSENPFIQTSTNIVTLSPGKSETVTAAMAGGKQEDGAAFIWTISDPSVAIISTGTGSCYIRGLASGQTYITVRNSNYPDAYTKTILVRVEDTVVEDCYISVSGKVIKLNPSDNNGEIVTATLENGDPLDAQDFVWWADDYNIVTLSSITDTARIYPTGIAGTTYIHVKHPKVLHPVDIIVMSSEYTEFAFSENSKTILDKTVSFIQLQIPSIGDDYWVEYESWDTTVCIATGSDRVCMIAGVSPGSTGITATLKTKNGVVGTAQLAVIVGARDESVNTISMNSTIINMRIGESLTLEALLSGNGINAQDYYNLEWTVTGNENSCVTLLQNEAGKTTGKNAYITAERDGTAVLTLSHPLCKYDLNVWIVIPVNEESTISLDQTYIEMYKSDGAVTVNAKVINGTSSDESGIIWTAPKVGGLNIVSISKSKGKSCNIVPRNVGSTTLRAQLPNGNYADCVITVLTDAEIILETTTLHVNPGFSETVGYTVTPENAGINWIKMMNGTSGTGTADYFDFSVNESTKTITVTGKELGSGTLYCYSASDSGTAKAQLNIICEYNYELEFDGDSGIILMQPDDTGLLSTRNNPHNLAEIPFHVYPKSGMEIKVESSTDALEITSYSFDTSTGTGIVYVKALTEEIDGYITLSATNPNDKVNTPVQRKKYINSKYESYTITPVFDIHTGSFTSFKNNNGVPVLTLGDGESYSFYLDIAEPNARLENIKVTYREGAGNDLRIAESAESDGEDSPHIYFSGSSEGSEIKPESVSPDGRNYYRIGHNHDYIEENGFLAKGEFDLNGFDVTGVTRKGAKATNIFGICQFHDWGSGYIITTKGDFKETSGGCNVTIKNLVKQYAFIYNTTNYYYYDIKNGKEPYRRIYHHDQHCPINICSEVIATDCNLNIHPGYIKTIKTTTSKNQSVKDIQDDAVIEISYSTVEGSWKTEKTNIKVCFEKRLCQSNTKDLWQLTKDLNGIDCWKFTGKSSMLAPSWEDDLVFHNNGQLVTFHPDGTYSATGKITMSDTYSINSDLTELTIRSCGMTKTIPCFYEPSTGSLTLYPPEGGWAWSGPPMDVLLYGVSVNNSPFTLEQN